MEIIYNKLVRDKIPEIIKAGHRHCEVKYVDGEEKEKLLMLKLQEEMEEYLQSKQIEELADVLEVIYALGELQGFDRQELEILRKGKAEERGSFCKGIKLIRVYE